MINDIKSKEYTAAWDEEQAVYVWERFVRPCLSGGRLKYGYGHFVPCKFKI